MVQFNKKLVVLALVVPISFSTWAANNGMKNMQGGMGGNQDNCQLTVDQIQLQSLSPDVIDDLLFMREEEKLARDVYKILYSKWFAKVFDNITQSEQKHMDQVGVFIDAYGLEDSASEQDGVFNNSSLQILYDQLVEQGFESELGGFKVGALIEEVDIEDLENAIARTDIATVKTMYTSLLNGSYNHLRAFTQQIIAREGSYTAQLLTQEQVDEILDAEHSNPQAGNANKLSSSENLSSTCFISKLSADQQTIQNGSVIDADQLVNVAYQVNVDTNDVGAVADWIFVANYEPMDSNPGTMFVRNAEQWQVWDGQVTGMPAASTEVVLQTEQTVPVFEGVLGGIPGQYTIHIGYRLEDNSLVYGKYPLVFSVNP